MNTKTFALLLLALTVLRAALVSYQDISPNEAYYALCARHPAPAYFDGPPGAMTLAALGEIVPQWPDTLWRLWAPVWGLIASLACFLLVRAMDNATRAMWTVLALNALPIFNAWAVRVRPELPALAFVLLGLWCAWRALHAERNPVGRWALTAGCFALAAQFSYAALAVVPGLALYTLCSRKHHRVPDVAGLVLVVTLPLALLGPALAWNASYEWVPLFPGTFRSLWEFSLGGFISSTARLLDKFSPLVLLILLVTWVAALRESRVYLRARFVALCALPGVLLAGYFALRDADPVFYLLLAAPLLLSKALTWWDGTRPGRAALGVGFVLAVVFSFFSLRMSCLTGRGWAGTAEELKASFLEKSADEHEGLFLIAGDAPLAAVLGYYLQGDLVPPEGHPAVYEVESQNISSQFGLWPSYDDFVESSKVADELFTEQKGENPFVGRSALYLSREPAEDVPQAVKAAFESVTFLKRLPPAGNDAGPLYLYFCENYQTLPL
jgi:hypothetical protein